jgi:hypothetical protein
MSRSRYWVTPSQTNMFPWKLLEYNNERCFLRGPSRDDIMRSIRTRIRETVVRKAVKRKLSCCSWKPAASEVSAEAEKSPLLRGRYQGTTREVTADWEGFACSVVIYKSVEIGDGAIIKCSHEPINPIYNPNHVYSHTHKRNNTLQYKIYSKSSQYFPDMKYGDIQDIPALNV